MKVVILCGGEGTRLGSSTGTDTMTGGRIKKIEKFINEDTLC